MISKILILYIASFVGSIAFGFQTVFLSIDLFSLGFSGITKFYLFWLVPAGFLFFPVFSFLKQHFPRHFISSILGSQIAGLLLMYILKTNVADGTNDPLFAGLANAFAATGFWQLHHLALAGCSSAERRVKEVTTAKMCFLLGRVLGAWLGGLGALYSGEFVLFWISCLFLTFSTIGLGSICPKLEKDSNLLTAKTGTVVTEGLLKTLTAYPRQYLGVCLEVIIEITSNHLFAVWLLATGASPGIVASLYAIRIASSILTAPFMELLIKQQKGREFLLASLTGVSGWLLLIYFPLTTFEAIIGVFLLGVGSFLFVTGLESRWYARRSISQILMREIVLTINRIVAIPLLSFFIFTAQPYYIFVSILSFALAAPFGRLLVSNRHESSV
jgi:hypothetical protein